MSDWRDEAELVGKLASTMIGKLEANRWRQHWRSEDTDFGYLLKRLYDEVAELEAHPSWEEAADVANFAAMIADRADLAVLRNEGSEG